jgi:MSHA pilin protein MshD
MKILLNHRPVIRQTRRAQSGFTLIETIIVIVLVGAMMAGMTALFVNNVSHSHRPYLRQKALAAANAYMDEIMTKRWNENTPIGGGCVITASGSCTTAGAPGVIAIGNDGESRSTYDDVDDFNGINESPPQDSTGTVMPGYTGFTGTVSVTQPGSAWNGVAAADVRLIVVNVTSSNNETISLTAYRVNY